MKGDTPHCEGVNNHLFQQSVYAPNEGESEDGWRGGVKADRENVAVAIVTSELSHKTSDHHTQISERRDEGQCARGLM